MTSETFPEAKSGPFLYPNKPCSPHCQNSPYGFYKNRPLWRTLVLLPTIIGKSYGQNPENHFFVSLFILFSETKSTVDGSNQPQSGTRRCTVIKNLVHKNNPIKRAQESSLQI